MTTAIQCPTFRPTLKIGNNGQDVKEMQIRLNLRFASIYTPPLQIPVDGDFGSQTQAAVNFLQCLAFLPVNGIVDATTWNFICNGATRCAQIQNYEFKIQNVRWYSQIF